MPRGIYDRTNAKKIQSKKGKLRWNKRRNELLESLKKEILQVLEKNDHLFGLIEIV